MSLNQKIASKSVQIEIKNFECEICRKKFKNKYRVERHRSTVHKNLVESYKCQNCRNLYFNTKDELEEHNRTLHSVQIQTGESNSKYSSNEGPKRANKIHFPMRNLSNRIFRLKTRS